MAVFPESMGRIDVDDPRGAIRVIDSYIRYMQERIEFANRQTTRTVTEAGITSVGLYEDLVTLRNTVQALASTINAALAAIAQDQLAISTLDGEMDALGGRVDALEEQYNQMGASVTQTESGATVTITDKDGTTTSADIADGVTPDFQIGTVTTLPADSDATASISGTAEEPVLNLGIPKGKDGMGTADVTGVTLLAHVEKPDKSSSASQDYEVTLSGNLSDFAFLYSEVGSGMYVLGGQFIPMSVFKSTKPGETVVAYYEMNYTNDLSQIFGGNVAYVSDTKVKGKFTGGTLYINIYGVGALT